MLENALITGGSGMIGNNINFGYKPTSTEMNITDINSINMYILKIKNISCIIHLAATNLRESEDNIIKAIDININGTTNMLNIAKKNNIPFVLISSGAVFSSDNSDIIFDENTVKCPNCKYGYTKSSSEEIGLLYDKSIIIRTGWLFGGNQKNHYKFVENVINNLFTNTEIKAANDFFGSPTYVIDLIEHMNNLICNLKFGIHHCINDGYASGYNIALEIAQILNIDNSLIKSVSSILVPNNGPNNRSKTEKLKSIHDYNKLRNWKESLKEYVLKYSENKINQNNNLIKINNIKILNKKWSNRTMCRLCNSYDLNIFYKMIPTPLANHFIQDIKNQECIPLDVCICNTCKHIQLLQIIDPIYQYSNYFYITATSNIMIDHLKNSLDNFIQLLNLQKTDNILEIGSNDGTCVKYLLDNDFINIIGVDPAENINNRHNLPILCDFFGKNIIHKLNKKFKLIFGFHCCAHIENIQDVFKTVYDLLDFDGTFIMEVGYFYTIFKKNYFDIIYHEHIDYHTCSVIQEFAKKNNLLLYKTIENNIQGGSIQFYFCKDNYKINIDESVNNTIQKEQTINLFDINNLINWKNKIIINGKDINMILTSLVNNGKTIVGYGASAKLTTFIYQYSLSNKTIKYIIDDNIYKQNLFTPGLHIPIKPLSILHTEKIDYIIIFCWNIADEIIIKLNKYRELGLRIIIPFPEIKII